MSQQQDSLDNLVQNWNANDTEIHKQIPSESALVTQINKQNRHKKIEVILNSVTSIALASYVISEMYIGLPSIADVILYSVFLVMALSIGLYTFFSARRFIAVSTANTQSHAVILLEQSKNNLKFLLFSRIIGSIVFLIMLFLLGLIVFVALNKTLEFKHYLVGGIALGGSMIMTGMFVWGKKQRIQLEHQIVFLTKLKD